MSQSYSVSGRNSQQANSLNISTHKQQNNQLSTDALFIQQNNLVSPTTNMITNDSFLNFINNQSGILTDQNNNQLFDTQEHLELSYQNDSIEMMGDWDQAGDESTLDMLQDFQINDHNNQRNQQNQILVSFGGNKANQIEFYPSTDSCSTNQPNLQNSEQNNIQMIQKKPVLGLKLTQNGQNFLSQVKTNTIRLFQKQSIIAEESASQCQTSYEPTLQIRNVSPLKCDNSGMNGNLFNQQSISFNKSYFNQSQSRHNSISIAQGISIINQSNNQNNNVSNNQSLQHDYQMLNKSQNSKSQVQIQTNSPKFAQQEINNQQNLIANNNQAQSDSMLLTQVPNYNSNGQNDIENKSGTIALPFFRRIQNQNNPINGQTLNIKIKNTKDLTPTGIYTSTNTNQDPQFAQSKLKLFSKDNIKKISIDQATKNVQILNYYSNQLPIEKKNLKSFKIVKRALSQDQVQDQSSNSLDNQQKNIKQNSTTCVSIRTTTSQEAQKSQISQISQYGSQNSQDTKASTNKNVTIKLSKAQIKLDKVIKQSNVNITNKNQQQQYDKTQCNSNLHEQLQKQNFNDNQNDKTVKFDLKKIISKNNIKVINEKPQIIQQNIKIQQKSEENNNVISNNIITNIQTQQKLKLKNSQIVNKQTINKPIKIQRLEQNFITNQPHKPINTLVENQLEDANIYQDIIQEEQVILRQLEKDMKCNQKFSEKTLISPNAVIYRPKSTQPLHRKSYSFNSPHLLGGFLREFNQNYQQRKQTQINNLEIQSYIDDSSIQQDQDPSFIQLEDQSFILANRYAI